MENEKDQNETNRIKVFKYKSTVDEDQVKEMKEIRASQKNTNFKIYEIRVVWELFFRIDFCSSKKKNIKFFFS